MNLKNCNQRQLVHIDFEKKGKKLIFFTFFQINQTFLFEIEFYVKNAVFEVLHIEIAQKLQMLKISLIFSDFLADFQFLPFF